MSSRQYWFLYSIALLNPVKSVPYFKFLSGQRPILMTLYLLLAYERKNNMKMSPTLRKKHKKNKNNFIRYQPKEKNTFSVPQAKPATGNLMSETSVKTVLSVL